MTTTIFLTPEAGRSPLLRQIPGLTYAQTPYTQALYTQTPKRAYRQISPKTLIFLIGIPGSGKSSQASYLHQNFESEIISPDRLRQQLFGDVQIQGSWGRIWQQAERELRRVLQSEKLAIYDATNAQCRQRRQTLACCRALGFQQIIGIWLDIPLEICLQRNQARDRQVPEMVIKNMSQALQLNPPSLADGLDCLQRYILVREQLILRSGATALSRANRIFREQK
jgi:predicted kinase